MGKPTQPQRELQVKRAKQVRTLYLSFSLFAFTLLLVWLIYDLNKFFIYSPWILGSLLIVTGIFQPFERLLGPQIPPSLPISSVSTVGFYFLLGFGFFLLGFTQIFPKYSAIWLVAQGVNIFLIVLYLISAPLRRLLQERRRSG